MSGFDRLLKRIFTTAETALGSMKTMPGDSLISLYFLFAQYKKVSRC